MTTRVNLKYHNMAFRYMSFKHKNHAAKKKKVFTI